MKTSLPLLLGLLLCGCASSKRQQSFGSTAPSSADSAKTNYWRQQQRPADADEAPRYRRLTITVPAHSEGGVQYEEQTRTILVAE